MKQLARSYVWWPCMDSEIEAVVKKCAPCQESRPAPPTAPLHPWEWPAQPWSRLHIDFAGPYLGHMFLVVVDAHSKWMDVRLMNSITAAKTIEQLRMLFATHGLPKKVVSDNGPTFTSQEFRDFMCNNGIVHVTCSPYHPSSNGLAERAVQSFKQGIKRITGATIQEKLSKYLFNYHITPHSTTGVTPAELLMGRRLRSRLDLLFPDVSRRVESQQTRQKQSHDSSKPVRTFAVGDLVYAENFSPSAMVKWTPGKIAKATGPLSYHIQLTDGSIVRRHVDHMRRRESVSTQEPPAPVGPVDPLILPDSPPDPPPLLPQNAVPSPPRLPPPLRRSQRHREQPDWFSRKKY